jgi:integrase
MAQRVPLPFATDCALPQAAAAVSLALRHTVPSARETAGIQNVRIHDLRHAGATILMTLGVPDPIVRKVTGHRSRELERYQHLTPELRALTVNLVGFQKEWTPGFQNLSPRSSARLTAR